MTVLIWFRRWCAVFNSFINIIPDQQMEDEAIKEKRTCAYLSCVGFSLKFAYSWLFSYIHQTGVFAARKWQGQNQRAGGNPWYSRGSNRGQSHLSFLSLFLCCNIFILDRYPIILEIFPIWGNCDLDFTKIVSVSKYLLSIYYYMLSTLLGSADTRVTHRQWPCLWREPENKWGRQILRKLFHLLSVKALNLGHSSRDQNKFYAVSLWVPARSRGTLI